MWDNTDIKYNGEANVRLGQMFVLSYLLLLLGGNQSALVGTVFVR